MKSGEMVEVFLFQFLIPTDNMNYSIKTLTPLHIGNGEEIMNNFGYIRFLQDQQIAILDQQKILSIIGNDQIDIWMNLLEQKGDVLSYLNQRSATEIIPEAIASRVLPIGEGLLGKPKNIREQLHSLGRPLLPGTSIKGGLRTVLFRLYVEEDSSDFLKRDDNLKDRRRRYKDAQLQSKYLGQDPNHDLMRLLQVGDLFFEETECRLSKSINLYGRNKWQFKNNLDQWVECISAHQESTIRLKYNQVLAEKAVFYQLEKKRFRGAKESYKLFDNRQVEDVSPASLFKFSNQHTRYLLEDELDFWDNQNNYPPIIDQYLEQLEELYQTVKPWAERKETSQCILRIGWGTGFETITGGWQKGMLKDYQYDKLVKELRPKKDATLPYPKTRRMLADGTPLGFIHISR